MNIRYPKIYGWMILAWILGTGIASPLHAAKESSFKPLDVFFIESRILETSYPGILGDSEDLKSFLRYYSQEHALDERIFVAEEEVTLLLFYSATMTPHSPNKIKVQWKSPSGFYGSIDTAFAYKEKGLLIFTHECLETGMWEIVVQGNDTPLLRMRVTIR